MTLALQHGALIPVHQANSYRSVGIIARDIRQSYCCLSRNQHGMREISRRIQVGAIPLNTATGTCETATNASSNNAAFVTELTRHERADSINSLAAHDGFVLDEGLELEKTPVANPVVHPSSSLLLPYSLEVFDHYSANTICSSDLFADVVVHPGHVTSFPTSKASEKSLAALCAFGLELLTQETILPLHHFCLRGMEKPAVARDGKVVYSEVDTKHRNVLSVVLLDGDLFGECEKETRTTTAIDNELTLPRTAPTREVFLVANGNDNCARLSTVENTVGELVASQVCASWEVVWNGGVLDDGTGLRLLHHAGGLPNERNANLRRKAHCSNIPVDQALKSNIVLHATLPRDINNVLQRTAIKIDSSVNTDGSWNRYLGVHNTQHRNKEVNAVYKRLGAVSCEKHVIDALFWPVAIGAGASS